MESTGILLEEFPVGGGGPAAPPTFGSIGTLLGAGTSAPAFAVPASVANNDIIVVKAYIDGNATVTAMPSGFVHVTGSPQPVATGAGFGEHSLVVAWKRATGADSGTYGFTLSSSTFVYGHAERYPGAQTTGDPWDITDVDQSGAVNVSTAPAVSGTTTGPNRLLVYAATNHNGDSGVWSPPTGLTQRSSGGSGVTNVEASDVAQVSAGATGNKSATHTVAGYMGAWLGALIGV